MTFKMPLKWSENLVFEQFGGLLVDFFQVCQFVLCFQSFLSFTAFKINMCSNCAYLPSLEFIKDRLITF